MVSGVQELMPCSATKANAQLHQTGLGNLIDVVGKPHFEDELAGRLIQMFQAEFVHFSHFPNDRPKILRSVCEDGSLKGTAQSKAYLEREMWQFDPTLNVGIRSDRAMPILTQLDTDRPETQELSYFYADNDIRERVVVYGRGVDGHLGLSIIRTGARGTFSAEERSRVGMIGEIAFPLLARHYALVNERNMVSSALTSLEIIENCLALCGHDIPKREAQVAARMLYGMTCEGISIDLSIGYETALSYKKRFYQRFNLGGFRDMLNWYMSQFSGTYFLMCDLKRH